MSCACSWTQPWGKFHSTASAKNIPVHFPSEFFLLESLLRKERKSSVRLGLGTNADWIYCLTPRTTRLSMTSNWSSLLLIYVTLPLFLQLLHHPCTYSPRYRRGKLLMHSELYPAAKASLRATRKQNWKSKFSYANSFLECCCCRLFQEESPFTIKPTNWIRV